MEYITCDIACGGTPPTVSTPITKHMARRRIKDRHRRTHKHPEASADFSKAPSLSEALGFAIVDSCEGCGKCCESQGTPPGYAAVLFQPHAWPQDTGDHARVAQLPEHAGGAFIVLILGRML